MEALKYDAVVIGAGMGGLCSAARLAHAGCKTLLVEKLPLLGGRFSTLEYKGYKLTTGAHAVERNGIIEQTYREVGAEFDIQPPHGPTMTYILKGRLYDIPQEGGGLRQILFELAGDKNEADAIMRAMRRAFTWTEPSRNISLHDWAAQFTTDPNLLELIHAIGTIMQTNSHEVSAYEYFQYLKVMRGNRDIGYPRRGNSEFVKPLADVVERHGGAVWMRAQAKRILVENEKAAGVTISRGGGDVDVRTEFVVSDCGPRATVKLAGERNFDRGYLNQMRDEFRPAASEFIIHIGSDRPLVDRAGVLMPIGSRRVIAITGTTLACPEYAPPGKHLTEVFAMCRSSTEPLDRATEIELALMDVREAMPDFDGHGEVLLVSRFGEGWPLMHAKPGAMMPMKTPIENLYNVGDGVLPSGWIGLVGCAETARLVAQDIQGRRKRSA